MRPAGEPVPQRRLAEAPGSRRQGSVLVLVMTILGLLFVTGLAFMATMSFEAEIMQGAREVSRIRPGTEQVMGDISGMMADTMARPGHDFASKLLSGKPLAYAEMPGVHNSFSPIEPYRDSVGNYLYLWATDIVALTRVNPTTGVRAFNGSDMTLTIRNTMGATLPVYMPPIDTTNWIPGERQNSFVAGTFNLPDYDGVAGADPVIPLDADGDGISDSYAVDISIIPGIDGNQRKQLAGVLNPAVNPEGTVYLGLRIVAHGGMVNVGESAPTMIRNVLGDLALDSSLFLPPFSPVIEEPSLRRRGFLPPMQLPDTRVQGNPLGPDPDAGGGVFAAQLFPINETLRDHRYWSYAPQEYGPDPDIPAWAILMDPAFATNSPADRYDRRHLVTTVSHDDLLRRPVVVEGMKIAGGPVERDEILAFMREVNINAAPTVCLGAGASGLPFEYPKYPYAARNSYTGLVNAAMPVNYDDPCECLQDNKCTPNPRKGQLRLSLPWMDDAFGILNSASPNQQQIRLIQDVFTIMLLNARGPDWGSFVGSPPKWTWTDLREVSLTAASLTANMLDYADNDDIPTRVELRSADYTDPNAFGRPIGETVWGLERQPFITEVVVVRVENPPSSGMADVGSSYFGVELFNPYGIMINLQGYSLSINGVSTPLGGNTLSPGEYEGFYSGDYMLPPSQEINATPINGIDIDENAIVRLVRDVGGASVVVDEFNLPLANTGSAIMIGKDGEPLASAERAVNNLSKWTAPIPQVLITDKATFGDENSQSTGGMSGVKMEFAGSPGTSGKLADAFPTTGSMLFIMRHANSITESFNSGTRLQERDPAGNYAIDNGRMPIFDLDESHRIGPEVDQQFVHPTNSLLDGLTLDRPGELMHLPWGQYIFDYFTALPLDSPGPYAYDAGGNLLIDEANPRPRVDMDGLRVHGRVNINAAPWKVLEGVPFVAMNKIPQPFKDDVAFALGFDALDPTLPQMLGESLAKAIVAYRELRELLGPLANGYTGNYDDGSANGVGPSGTGETGRGWAVGGTGLGSLTQPAYRRGTGFMTVGELANVRHRGAFAAYRFDSAVINPAVAGGQFEYAVAALAALSDWVTVRSQTFTVYGTLRGDVDPVLANNDVKAAVRDVDSRALRFQETVDRLPLFLGERAPGRIGDRVMGKYLDHLGG